MAHLIGDSMAEYWEDTRERLERWLDGHPTIKWEYERLYEISPEQAYDYALGCMKRLVLVGLLRKMGKAEALRAFNKAFAETGKEHQ